MTQYTQIIVTEYDKDYLILLPEFSKEEAADLKEWRDVHREALPPGSPQGEALRFILAYRNSVSNSDQVTVVELEHFAEIDLKADVADVWKVLNDYEKLDFALAVFKDVVPTRENTKAIYDAYTALIAIEEKYPTALQLLAELTFDSLVISRFVTQ